MLVEGLVLLGLAGLGWWLYSRGQSADPTPTDNPPPVDPWAPVPPPETGEPNPAYDWASGYDTPVELPPIITAQSVDRNRAAFLAMIRDFESAGRYDVIYGGRTFSDFSAHPRVYVPINLPGYVGQTSSAAGAYQFIFRTWATLRDRLGLPDFSPASQDAAALELLREIGALPYIDTGDFDAALRRASTQWASLPYSTAGQPKHTVAAALDRIAAYG